MESSRANRRNIRRRRRWPLRLVVTIVIVIGLLVGADFVVRAMAERQLSTAVKRHTSAAAASATIGPFPLLYHLVVQGTVPDLQVKLRDVPAGRLQLSTVELMAADVHIDRHDLFFEREIRITAVSSATVTVTVSTGELSNIVARDLTVSGSMLRVHIGPVVVPVLLAVSAGVLTLTAGALHLVAFRLTDSPIIPVCRMRPVVTASSIALSCHVAPVPASVISALPSLSVQHV